ncbi:hypothetical protein IAU59_002941 [Kwoniella sp. CBS 9459]
MQQPAAGPSTVVLTEKRGLRACSACRISAAIACRFTTTRRGRVKGSKNRKTLEKLANQLGDANKTRPSPSSSTGQARPDNGWSTNDQIPIDPPVMGSQSPEMGAHPMTRAQSPLDPFMSAVTSPTPAHQPNAESMSPTARQPMTRSAVQTMAGSFPTGSERAISDPVPRADFSTGKDVHNPLLFLAECARRGWDSADGSDSREHTTTPAPSTRLPIEDAIRLSRWSKENLSQIIADQRRYFEHGLHGVKRDVSIGLDPVYQNVIKEEQVTPLFDSYFRHVHRQWSILERNVHNPNYVRSRSAFLFTVVLALGATAMATLSSSTVYDSTLALKLWGHLEKLQLVVCATAAKSVEIVQGMLLAQMWALRTPRLVDDQRATRLGMAVRMANQIGLQLSKHRGCDSADQRTMNDLRTRLSLVLVESRWESIADRQDISCPGFDLTEFEAEELDRTQPQDDNAIIAADYALYRFEAESKERLSRVPQNNRAAVAIESERIWIQTYLSSWNCKWADAQTDPLRRWWFRYHSLRSRLIGILRVAKARTQPGPLTDHMKADLLLVSTELLEGCLSHERAMHMLRPTSPIVFAAAILLQLTSKDAPERDLILRVALRLAGEPKHGDIMTYAVHNGYQILNMLCLSKEVARTPAGPTAFDHHVNTVIDPAVLPAVGHSYMIERNAMELHQQQSQQSEPGQTAHATMDPLIISSHQSFYDIDQLLGLGHGFGFSGSGSTDFGQWQNTANNHPPNTMWSDFLSTEPSSTSRSDLQPSEYVTQNSNSIAWGGNGAEDPLNLLMGDRQMTDNERSDFYFHLASALGS